MLVFALTVAAFVTPALMGGPSLIVLSTLIYQQMTVTLEWGFGAAVATILLVVTTGLFLVYQRSRPSRARRRAHRVSRARWPPGVLGGR